MQQVTPSNFVRFITWVFVFYICIGYFTVNAYAQTSIGLSISPPTFEISANPGETIKNSIRVTNVTEDTQEIVVESRNFTAIGEQGSVGLTEENTNFSLAKWITTTPAQWVIEPNESYTFEFEISAPVNAEPGGHFGSIVFRTGAKVNPNQTGAAVAQEVGSLILLKIAGDVTEKASIESFAASQSWYEHGPVTFDARFANKGNVHIKTRGTITISDIFGRTVGIVPLTEKNVLPDAVRRIDATWDNSWGFSKYTAVLSTNYGESNTEILTASTTFFIIPYRLVGAICIGLLVMSFILYRGRNRIRLALKALAGRDPTP
ncbi:hypothetical protein HGA91_05120 [candidate division WWE3 bacterium]|nr:hypothetical protein [candidate division WWE3 bacterium]